MLPLTVGEAGAAEAREAAAEAATKETTLYPAHFLIDREGRLRTAPSTDGPFATLEAMVDALPVPQCRVQVTTLTQTPCPVRLLAPHPSRHA